MTTKVKRLQRLHDAARVIYETLGRGMSNDNNKVAAVREPDDNAELIVIIGGCGGRYRLRIEEVDETP